MVKKGWVGGGTDSLFPAFSSFFPYLDLSAIFALFRFFSERENQKPRGDREGKKTPMGNRGDRIGRKNNKK